jgi:transcriptional regulator with XRE-family HTH domain
MEISPAQCRAARALLNWTQDKLAVKTGVALKTIRGFESGRRNPLGVTRAAIKQALEQAGIEFLDGDRKMPTYTLQANLASTS